MTRTDMTARWWKGALVLLAAAVLFEPATSQEASSAVPQRRVVRHGPMSMGRAEVRLPEGKDQIRLPLTTSVNHIILPISVNDSEPLPIVLDTGMPSHGLALFESDAVEGMSLNYGPIRARVGGAGGDGKHVEAKVATGATFTVGEMTIEDAHVIVLPSMSQFTVHHAGIIGYAIFQNFTVHVDYDRDELILARPGTLPAPGDAAAIPLEIRNNLPFLKAGLTTGDGPVPINLVMDLGATHAVSLNSSSRDDISVPGGAVATRIGRGLSGVLIGQVGRIPGLTLGGHTLEKVVATFPDPEFENPRGVDSRDGNLGMDILNRFNFTIDYAGKVMYVQPNKSFGDPYEWDMSGLTLEPGGEDGVEVAEVLADSPAAAAGMQAGDVVIAIDGESVSAKDRNRVRELLQRDGAEVSIRFRRGEETGETRFRLRRLV